MFEDTSFSEKPRGASNEKRDYCLTHLFIRQIKEIPPGADIAYFGRQVTTVCILGRLKNVEKSSTRIHYTIADHTGGIIGQYYQSDPTKDDIHLKINSYVRMFGSIRLQDGNRYIAAVKLEPVFEYHEILIHRLSCLRNRVLSEQISKGISVSTAMGNPGRELAASMMALAGENGHNMAGNGGASDEGVGGLKFDKPILNKIMGIIAAGREQHGVTVQTIQAKLPQGFHKELRQSMMFLVAEGHVYTTLTDEHYQITGA